MLQLSQSSDFANRLTQEENLELVELESTIHRGLRVFWEVGNALLTIREKRLYRASHGTFETYCNERWGFSDENARLAMRGAEVFTRLQQTPTIVGVLPVNECQVRELSKLAPEEQPIVWQEAVATAPNGKVTGLHVKATAQKHKEAHQLINASTSNEWYTPSPFIEAAREVLGDIDLDPASNYFANKVVRAKHFYTPEQDGLSQKWWGKVFLNPPYGKEQGGSNQGKWSTKLIEEYENGNVSEALLLVNAATGNSWFAPLWGYHICFVSKRIAFYNQETKAGQPTHSNVVVYLGSNTEKFIKVFNPLGAVAKRCVPQE